MVTMGRKTTISLSKIIARVCGVAIMYPIREVRAESIDWANSHFDVLGGGGKRDYLC